MVELMGVETRGDWLVSGDKDDDKVDAVECWGVSSLFSVPMEFDRFSGIAVVEEYATVELFGRGSRRIVRHRG